jgi:hypothetical protein
MNTTIRPIRWSATVVTVAALACSLAAYSLAGPAASVTLAPKLHPGEVLIYETQTHTNARVRTDPSELRAFLPPLPTEISTHHQNTLTVRAIHPDGIADVENRFDRFELQYELPQETPQELRAPAMQQEQEFCRRVNGQTLLAHYDRHGRLLGFEGAEAILLSLSAPLREPLQQALKFFLEQMGGAGFYPGHAVKPGEEWKHRFRVQGIGSSSAVQGEIAYRYTGETQHLGTKAAIIEVKWTDLLAPPLADGGTAHGPQAGAQGNDLRLELRGQGQGRLLVALDGGHILANRSSIQQTLKASLKGVPGINRPPSDRVTVEVTTETTFEMDKKPEPAPIGAAARGSGPAGALSKGRSTA